MKGYEQLHPEYGFERHKGYATDAHLAAGSARASTLHRRSWRAVWRAGELDQELQFWSDQRSRKWQAAHWNKLVR
jgi:ribonuclease HII